jgi:hypothetical protein
MKVNRYFDISNTEWAELAKHFDIEFPEWVKDNGNEKRRRHMLRNIADPNMGLHILQSAMRVTKQEVLL